MDKPIKVKLMPDGDGLRLGPLRMCGASSDWLRKAFPKGATFDRPWAKCKNGYWMGYVARRLAAHAYGDTSRQWMSMFDRTSGKAPAQIRAAVPYAEIEALIRKVMAGRPEVIG